MPAQTFSISLSGEIVKKIDNIAKRDSRTRRGLIRGVLSSFIKKEEDEGRWETVVDFHKIKRTGVSFDELGRTLRRMKAKYG